MSLTAQEATAIVQMLDVSWSDIPLRPETISVWVNELTKSDRVIFDMNDAVGAVRYLLMTEPRRPALCQIIDEGRSQHKATVDRWIEGGERDADSELAEFHAFFFGGVLEKPQ